MGPVVIPGPIVFGEFVTVNLIGIFYSARAIFGFRLRICNTIPKKLFPNQESLQRTQRSCLQV